MESAKEEIIRGIKNYEMQVNQASTINSTQQDIDLSDDKESGTKEEEG